MSENRQDWRSIIGEVTPGSHAISSDDVCGFWGEAMNLITLAIIDLLDRVCWCGAYRDTQRLPHCVEDSAVDSNQQPNIFLYVLHCYPPKRNLGNEREINRTCIAWPWQPSFTLCFELRAFCACIVANIPVINFPCTIIMNNSGMWQCVVYSTVHVNTTYKVNEPK